MIQNLFIIRNGIAILMQHFGECHALHPDDVLVSSYLSALQMLSKEITGGLINSINFENVTFYFYNDPNDDNLSYVIVADIDDDRSEIDFKIRRIAEIFYERYQSDLQDFKGDITEIKDFSKILNEMNITQKNCGGRPECAGCPNSTIESRIIKSFIDSIKK